MDVYLNGDLFFQMLKFGRSQVEMDGTSTKSESQLKMAFSYKPALVLEEMEDTPTNGQYQMGNTLPQLNIYKNAGSKESLSSPTREPDHLNSEEPKEEV